MLKVKGLLKPACVVIHGEAVKEPSGEFYLEWRSDGKRRQVPCGSDPRAALDAWRIKAGVLNGTIDFEPEEVEIPVSKRSIRSAFDQLLVETDATKRGSPYRAYANDLRWFQESIERRNVAQVTRDDIIHVLSIGRDEGLAQSTINRRVQTGLRALRSAGSTIMMKRGDWPRIAEVPVEIYSDEELSTFFEACNPEEWMIFQVFLQSGLRKREVSTLRWQDVNFQHNVLGVTQRLEYGFQPKSYKVRSVRVPKALMSALKQWRKSSRSRLVFPTSPHPLRPDCGGDAPDEHHLELCKEIAYSTAMALCSRVNHSADNEPHRLIAGPCDYDAWHLAVRQPHNRASLSVCRNFSAPAFVPLLTMRRLLIFPSIFVLAILLPGAAIAKPMPPASAAPVARLPIELFHNRIYLPVSINGRPGFTMVVDTGSSASGLSRRTAAALHLRLSRRAQVTGNGNQALHIRLTKNVQFAIGAASLDEKTVAVVPMQSFERLEGRQVAGILGVELFRRYVVVLDYPAKRLELYDPAGFHPVGHGIAVPLRLLANTAIFDAAIQVPNRPPILAKLAIDSGTYSGLRLYSPFVKKNHLAQTIAPTVASFGFGLGGEFPERLGRVAALTIGTLRISEPLTDLPEASHGATASAIYDGTIGGAILRRFTVTLDYPRRQMLLSPGLDFDAPIPADASGLVLESLDPAAGEVDVRHVLPDTPASAAGFQPGDRIVSVNGTPAEAIGIDGARSLFCQEGSDSIVVQRNGHYRRMIMIAGKPLD